MSAFEHALIVAAWILAPVILALGIDDLAIDITAHLRNLKRRMTVYRRYRRASADDFLSGRSECPIAILIPAWREEIVIGSMLRRLRAVLDYSDYHVYVGIYPNDPATRRAVEAVDPDRTWLSPVMMPRPGPTSKADCLNMLYLAAQSGTAPSNRAFAAFVLHDAEDLVDAGECRVFSALIHKADMIQLPVIPLVRSPFDLIAGHYLDEFAENHQKDMILREAISGAVPSAGVGCAFSARALGMIAKAQGGRPFPDGHMTEDYSLALRLARLGLKTIFVSLPLHRTLRRIPVATRGYFPDRLGTAVRQKARWLIGIGLQSWQEHGWPGSLATRLMLYRDRKALITPFIGLAANILLLLVMLHVLLNDTAPDFASGPHGAVLLHLIACNLFLLLMRAGHRVAYVARLHGLPCALMSLPRMAIANIVNSGASARALFIYCRHRMIGTPLRWDKTEHLQALPEIREC